MRESTPDEQALALRFSYLPLPADAIDCEPWQWHRGAWRRHFLTFEWNIGGIWVCVVGEQSHLGEITRWLHVGGEDTCSTSDRQQLIEALTAAGHLLDSLTQPADPAMATISA